MASKDKTRSWLDNPNTRISKYTDTSRREIEYDTGRTKPIDRREADRRREVVTKLKNAVDGYSDHKNVARIIKGEQELILNEHLRKIGGGETYTKLGWLYNKICREQEIDWNELNMLAVRNDLLIKSLQDITVKINDHTTNYQTETRSAIDRVELICQEILDKHSPGWREATDKIFHQLDNTGETWLKAANQAFHQLNIHDRIAFRNSGGFPELKRREIERQRKARSTRDVSTLQRTKQQQDSKPSPMIPLDTHPKKSMFSLPTNTNRFFSGDESPTFGPSSPLGTTPEYQLHSLSGMTPEYQLESHQSHINDLSGKEQKSVHFAQDSECFKDTMNIDTLTLNDETLRKEQVHDYPMILEEIGEPSIRNNTTRLEQDIKDPSQQDLALSTSQTDSQTTRDQSGESSIQNETAERAKFLAEYVEEPIQVSPGVLFFGKTIGRGPASKIDQTRQGIYIKLKETDFLVRIPKMSKSTAVATSYLQHTREIMKKAYPESIVGYDALRIAIGEIWRKKKRNIINSKWSIHKVVY